MKRWWMTLKGWLGRRARQTADAQGPSFMDDYPRLRRRWLRIDLLGVLFFIILLALFFSGALDDETTDVDTGGTPIAPTAPTPTLNGDEATPAPTPISRAEATPGIGFREISSR